MCNELLPLCQFFSKAKSYDEDDGNYVDFNGDSVEDGIDGEGSPPNNKRVNKGRSIEWVTTNKYLVNVTVTIIVTLYISHLHLEGLGLVLGQKMQMGQEMQQMQVEVCM